MDWQNLYGWYLDRPVHETVPVGSILVGRESLEKGRYLLFIVGPNTKIILEPETKLSRTIGKINYQEEDIKLSNVWVYLPDIASNRLTVRCEVDTKAPEGPPTYPEYDKLASFGEF